MRKLILAISLSLAATAAYACVTNVMTVNGKTVICTTCCAGNVCNTTCV